MSTTTTTGRLRTVATWRGIASGWVAVGPARQEAEALRLLSIVERIRPDFRSAVR
jgi:hypothetical protein